MKKILVPTDFSDCSENALIYAMQLADEISANLQLLNIPAFDTSTMESPISAKVVLEKQNNSAKRRLIESVEKATESIRSIVETIPSIKTKVEMGRAESIICDLALSNDVDYIVLGNQGENYTLDKYVGTVASNVMRNAPCPVIVIPDNARFGKDVVMGYATDFSDADPFEIWKAMKLFEPFQPKIKCVHLNEKKNSGEDKIDQLVSYFSETSPDLNVEFHSISVTDKVKDMNEFIENQNINMLVMYKPKRTFFESIFHKSYTLQMARHTNIPLLVYRQIR